ncbi:DUF1656 domain-containing protein [Sphingomonas sp. H39-1-10]|uniref:DUF1656 domain-containing protein n=1 Tax=Sphingomonas TaxID=13687 RepID=UPI0008803A2D|nr:MULTISPECIES: DUF1656 domain-containing protein [Sphingomonas]MDF0489435.1 DUF1656 domain-containing protein [Sphingomonas pollutisoli]SDA29370.1 Protein of unknown function [Sphingomonas sp. NFR15]
MTGEVSLFGVYVPGLLLLAVVAAVLAALVSRMFSLIGLYRVFAYRPLVDVAIYIIILGGLVLAFAPPGVAL